MEQYNSQSLLDNILSNFDFSYMITINILTYVTINIIDIINGCKAVSLLTKRACLLCSIFVIGYLYYINDIIDIKLLINSSVAAPVFWSWVIKPILSKTKYDYRQIDSCLKK